jgi:hypothetical protein
MSWSFFLLSIKKRAQRFFGCREFLADQLQSRSGAQTREMVRVLGLGDFFLCVGESA